MEYEKLYKESLERAKIWQGHLNECGDKDYADELNYIFPELAESEDEKIRKGIIRNLEYLMNRAEGFVKDELKERIAWLEKQEQEKHLSEPIKDYQGSFGCWNNAHDFRPKHLQRCICYDKYMGGVYCYVYDDISKYWCTQTTEEHDPDGDNHICDYADYRVIVWMPLPDTSFYSSKSWLEKQGEISTKSVHIADIPFGAKDSELQEVTYFIPKGYYAKIEGDKVVIKKGEENPATIDVDKMVGDYAKSNVRDNEEFGKPLPCMIRAYRQGLNDAINGKNDGSERL